jgi:hypothetical protein
VSETTCATIGREASPAQEKTRRRSRRTALLHAASATCTTRSDRHGVGISRCHRVTGRCRHTTSTASTGSSATTTASTSDDKEINCSNSLRCGPCGGASRRELLHDILRAICADRSISRKATTSSRGNSETLRNIRCRVVIRVAGLRSNNSACP